MSHVQSIFGLTYKMKSKCMSEWLSCHQHHHRRRHHLEQSTWHGIPYDDVESEASRFVHLFFLLPREKLSVYSDIITLYLSGLIYDNFALNVQLKLILGVYSCWKWNQRIWQRNIMTQNDESSFQMRNEDEHYFQFDLANTKFIQLFTSMNHFIAVKTTIVKLKSAFEINTRSVVANRLKVNIPFWRGKR